MLTTRWRHVHQSATKTARGIYSAGRRITGSLELVVRSVAPAGLSATGPTAATWLSATGPAARIGAATSPGTGRFVTEHTGWAVLGVLLHGGAILEADHGLECIGRLGGHGQVPKLQRVVPVAADLTEPAAIDALWLAQIGEVERPREAAEQHLRVEFQIARHVLQFLIVADQAVGPLVAEIESQRPGHRPRPQECLA